jgi:membrane fusion protein (multidrug efflux system)
MRPLIYLLIPAIVFASCSSKPDKSAELAKLKTERADLDLKIKALEASKTDSGKVTPVSVSVLEPTEFNSYVEVNSQISGDENVLATSRAPGMVNSITVSAGQKVSKGQTLALLDVSTITQQISAMSPQLNLQKSVYERQQKLWEQNIGTEVQLMTAKAQYESTQKQIESLESQRDLYRIISPISGTVDQVGLKIGDYAAPGANGIRVVSYDKLKAEANLGENYLGKVKQGDPVTLVLPDVNDTIKTVLTYVSQAVDPISRAFMVQVRLGNNIILHPNMSCIMKISNYKNPHALVVPVSVIQKTSQGEMLYIADGDKAKSVPVTTGRNSNGLAEVLSGLSPGDKVITTGYEDMDNGERIVVQ